MSLTRSGRTMDDAASSSPAVALLARKYEADLRASPLRRPEPRDYLPDDPALRPAALLALLRIDLAQRWQAWERVPVEWYRDRYPELDDEALVALIYEEYCLREEAGESPTAADYDARFPVVAAPFRAVLEIHHLFGRDGAPGTFPPPSFVRGTPPTTSQSPSLSVPPTASTSTRPAHRGWAPLPEVGQTIAGFRLVEELGRGSFARVFRAEERQLADRPVAMKVTRTGSREPQTLARLQHTHIVPVYSYRTDPATGLHLLCMPYLGRLTLAQVLGDPAIRGARTGADLAALLDRLRAPDRDAAAAGRPATARHAALSRRTYARAIAWWGARLAEALQHAHDRGVLHRDIKPSNILITDDGLPMLLDFNLAQEPWLDDPDAAPAALGGTLAYMAPEQLEALAQGEADWVDARSDLYALGVVLYECLVRGARMFALPSGAATVPEAMRRAAAARRGRLPRVRDANADVPAALEAVVQHCLAPDPGDRYANASELALDLQAAADDAPLRFAREPLPSRTAGWLRRNRRRLALAAPLIVACAVSATALVDAQLADLRIEAEVRRWLLDGEHAVADDRMDLAESYYNTAGQLAGDDARFKALRDQARAAGRRAHLSKEVRDQADHLFAEGERLRFTLLGFGGDPRTACRRVEDALARFSVPGDPGWWQRPRIQLLDPPRRDHLFDEVNELLFLWVVALDRDRPGGPDWSSRAVRICAAALGFATPRGPWEALAARQAALRRKEPPPVPPLAPPAGEGSARGCFQWALLCKLEGRDEATIAWLERATRLAPDDYWSEFYLGLTHERAGNRARALAHYQAAVALRKHSPWAWYNRALLHHARGDWDRALDDLDRALAEASEQGFDFLEARLELGVVKQALGDAAGARAASEAVIDASAGEPLLARAGRLNRASLDIDSGAVDRAWAEYDALLAEDPRDVPARLGRALLALRLGRAARAEADLTRLLQEDPENAAAVFAWRALARLSLGRPLEAEADAADAYRRQPGPGHERVWIRTLLALGRVQDLLWLKAPDDLAVLPAGGPALRADLRTAAARLRDLAAGAETGAGRAASPALAPALVHRTRAVILSALGGPAAAAAAAAEAEASRAIALAPGSDDAYLVRARVRRRGGDLRGALVDVEAGLALEPGDPSLLELSGLLQAETGHPAAALIVLNRAVLRGAPGTIHAAKAQALGALGRPEAAVEEWSLALAEDPEDPRAYLGRARALIRRGLWDRALADLEQAADWANHNPALLTRVALTSAACLPARPDHLPQWLAHARRAWSAWQGMR